MIKISQTLIDSLLEGARENPRLRVNHDLRTSEEDSGQRMLNALMPGTMVPIHRHPRSNESVLLLKGKLYEVLFDDNGNEMERVLLDVAQGALGCVEPQGV